MNCVGSFALATALVSAQTADFDALRRKAEAGDAKAQFDLAEAFSEGNGVAKDSAKGMEWLRRSALQGYAGAQVVLGYMSLFLQRLVLLGILSGAQEHRLEEFHMNSPV